MKEPLKKNILVSVVVPVYNVQEYIRKCIESIMGQSYKNIEIIIVDDGSTDNCPGICDYYARIDRRIKVIHKKNGGLVSARKEGTAVATGEYILNIDGDDWIEKDRIEVLVVDGILRANADMIYLSGYKKDFEKSSILIDYDIPIKTFYGDEVRNHVFPLLYDVDEVFKKRVQCSMWCWAVKRDLLQEKQRLVDDRIVMQEDSICIWFCLIDAKSVTLIRQNGYHYIQRKSSLGYMAAELSEINRFKMNIWYHQLRDYLNLHNVISDKINQIFICMTIFGIIMADYELILKKHLYYLFPYPKVKKGSRVIVYGAGKMGYVLMKYLAYSKDYSVLLWVDQDVKRSTLSEYKVSSVDEIDGVEYDYVVVAVTYADMANQIKEKLLLKGISEEKIATMESDVISEEAIPDEIKCRKADS